MAEQENVETNPVLAIGLAGVALIGVLGSFLPPGLVDRMTASHEGPSSEPAPLEATQQSASVAQDTEVGDMGRSQAAPEPETAALPAQPESTAVTEESTEPEEVAPLAGSEQADSATSPATPGLYAEPQPQDETEAAAGIVSQEKERPAQSEYRQRPRLPPEPVYRQVPPWGGYPPPAYPPVYNPYYGQPPY